MSRPRPLGSVVSLAVLAALVLAASAAAQTPKQGEAGQIVAMVAVSWIEKPVVSSSRWSRLRIPPGLPGVGAAGGAAACAAPKTAARSRPATMVAFRIRVR